MLFKSEKQAPADAEIISHKLLARAGMIYKVASGIYSYLPLALRVIKKVENIVREEMNAGGAQEILMTVLQPAELWKESGRWEQYGLEMMRLKDRNEREFCLGPTHEELVTTLVSDDVNSYRQLPLNVYQIHVKFRDEIRPRFGLMRVREFHMKDGYSFDRTEEDMVLTYNKMFEAYGRIFSRYCLPWRAVESESGLIGGKISHEFMVLANTGEEAIAYCDTCDYAANIEVAKTASEKAQKEEPLAIEKVHTPGLTKVEEVAKFLNVPADRLVKMLIVKTDGKKTGVLLRGDRELSLPKLSRKLGQPVSLLPQEEFGDELPFGYVGPVNAHLHIIADRDVKQMNNFVTGANEKDYHFANVNIDRDFKVDDFEDLIEVKEGDRCPHCEGKLGIARGIEVGNIFQLGRKYSKALNKTFTDADGSQKPFVMGCYGIGIGRVMASIVEIHNDEKGIIWPLSVSPYQILVIPLQMDDDVQKETAFRLYRELEKKGFETLIDDREERPGVKFSDADLIGIPIQVIVGKNVAEGKVEIKIRRTNERRLVAIDEAVKETCRTVDDLQKVEKELNK